MNGVATQSPMGEDRGEGATIFLPPHSNSLPPGEREQTLKDTDCHTETSAVAHSRKCQTLRVPQQSWGFTFD